MMKKMLAVMLVLVMASVSSAAIVELAEMTYNGAGEHIAYVGGDIPAGSFAVGDIIPLAIVVYGGDAQALQLFIEASAGLQFVDGGREVVDFRGVLYSDPLATAAGVLDFNTSVAVAAAAVGYEGAATPPANIADGSAVMWGFSVKVLDANGGTLSFSSNSRVVDDNQQDMVATLNGITFVPEPMTVALLGLGGLFLRRRK